MLNQEVTEPNRFYYLRQLIWLRRLLWKRRWKAKSAVLHAFGSISVALAMFVGTLGFFVALAVGILLFPEFPTTSIAVTLGVLTYFYVVLRIFGLVLGMQSGEGYPMENLLHLPFSVRQVFYLNFAMAQLSLATLVFLPILLGLTIGTALSLGAVNSLLVLFILAVFLFTAAAIYQFQLWLETSIRNPRHRLFILACLSFVSVMLLQAPNFYNLFQSRQDSVDVVTLQPTDDINQTNTSSTQPLVEFDEEDSRSQSGFLNGWVIDDSSVERIPWKLISSIVVLLVLAGFNLRRSFRQTLVRYQLGRSAGGSVHFKQRDERSSKPKKRMSMNLGRAVSYISLRMFIRSSFGKLALIAPLNFIVMIGVLWLVQPGLLSPNTLPLTIMAVAALGGLPTAIAFNLFALDGPGFTSYLLSGLDLRHLLLGKFLVIVPLFVVIAVLLMVVATLFSAQSLFSLISLAFQLASVFLLTSLIALYFSVRYPVPISPKSNSARGSGAKSVFAFFSEFCTLVLLILFAWILIRLDGGINTGSSTVSYFLLGSIIEFVILLACFRFLYERIVGQLNRRALEIQQAVTAIPQ